MAMENMPLIAIKLHNLLILLWEFRETNDAWFDFFAFLSQLTELFVLEGIDGSRHHGSVCLKAGQGVLSLPTLLREVKAAEENEYAGSYQAHKPLDKDVQVADYYHCQHHPPILFNVFLILFLAGSSWVTIELNSGPNCYGGVGDAINTNEGESGQGRTSQGTLAKVAEGADTDVANHKEYQINAVRDSCPIQLIRALFCYWGLWYYYSDYDCQED